MKREVVEITTDYILLAQFIKWVGLAETGGQAKFLIDEGKIKINDVPVTERRKKIFPGDSVTIGEIAYSIQQEKK